MSQAISALMIKQKFTSLFLLAAMSFLERESCFARREQQRVYKEYFTQAANFRHI
jgi:hypothetical protein